LYRALSIRIACADPDVTDRIIRIFNVSHELCDGLLVARRHDHKTRQVNLTRLKRDTPCLWNRKIPIRASINFPPVSHIYCCSSGSGSCSGSSSGEGAVLVVDRAAAERSRAYVRIDAGDCRIRVDKVAADVTVAEIDRERRIDLTRVCGLRRCTRLDMANGVGVCHQNLDLAGGCNALIRLWPRLSRALRCACSRASRSCAPENPPWRRTCCRRRCCSGCCCRCHIDTAETQMWCIHDKRKRVGRRRKQSIMVRIHICRHISQFVFSIILKRDGGCVNPLQLDVVH
jgi:hypothetical protein